EVPPILGGGANVCGRLGLIETSRRRHLDLRRCESRAAEPLRCAFRIAWTICHGAEPDANKAPAAVGRGQAGHPDADDGKVTVPPRMLEDDGLGAGAVGKLYGLEHLRRLEGRRVRALEESLRAELAAPRAADDVEARTQRHRAERHLASRV